MRDPYEGKRSNSLWWKPEIDDEARVETIHRDIVGYVRWLLAANRRRHTMDRIMERIYENDQFQRGGRYEVALANLEAAGMDVAALNVCKSIVDTWVSKMSKRRPMPMARVDDASWSFKRKAKQFTKFIKAKLYETDFEKEYPLVVRDAAVRGSGVMKITESFGEICPERTPREEILVDPREARYGRPRQLHQVKAYAREVLAEMFPDKREEIALAPSMGVHPSGIAYDDLDGMAASDTSNQILVYESWHLPSSHEADDGRWAITIEGATLQYCEWECPRFPFAMMHYDSPMRGFWGIGIMKQIVGIQGQINRIVRDIQMNLEVTGKVIVMAPRAAKINKAHTTGRKPFLVEYDLAPPQWHVPDATTPAQMGILNFLIQQAHDITGVSMMSATAKNPLGAGASGVALDNFYDIESERHAMQEGQLGTFRLECGELYIDRAREIADRRAEDVVKRIEKSEEGGDEGEDRGYSTTWIDKDAIERIDWRDVELRRDQFKLQLEPVNFLPDTRAGKLAAAEALTKAGVIPQEYTANLFDEPDIQRVNRVRNAPYNNLERVMERLADVRVDMIAIAPDPHFDLKTGMRMAKDYYNMSMADGAPEEVLDRYRVWISAAKDVLDRSKTEEAASAPPAPPPGPPGPMGPAGMQGPPGMPPEMPPMPMPPGGGEMPMPGQMPGMPQA